MEKKYTKMKLKEIQENLDTLKTLKFSKNKSFNNITEVLDFACINDYHTDNSTMLSNSNKKIQCNSNRMRGISDLYRISKYYFPDTKLDDIVKYIKSRPFQYLYCYTTNQDVFRHTKMNKDDNYIYGRVVADKNNPSIRLKNRKRVYIDQ